MKFKLAPSIVYFVLLSFATIVFSDLLVRIEEQEDNCSNLRMKQSEMAISLRLVPLMSRLDEVLDAPKALIEKNDAERKLLTEELKIAEKDTELVCGDVANLKRLTAFVEASLTAVLALVGLYAGFWLGSKQDLATTPRVQKRPSRKSGKPK